MRVFDPLTLLALPNDIAVQCDGYAARCGACHVKHLAGLSRAFKTSIDSNGVHVLDDVARHDPTVAPLVCWDCNIRLRGLNDLNPV